MQFEERALNLLHNWLGEGMGAADNPFIKEGEEIYMRFDAIEIANTTDKFGGVVIRYKWLGRTTMSQRVEDTSFVNTDYLCINGIEGRMRVAIQHI
jgi:hypothetical protein